MPLRSRRMKNDTPAPVRRHLNLKVSPNAETLDEIRRIVSSLANPQSVITIQGPWDGAILTSLKGVKGKLVAVDSSPSAELQRVVKATKSTLEAAVPADTTVLIIDSALTGMARSDAESAFHTGIPNILIHNTRPQLANVPKPLLTAAAGVTYLTGKGYTQTSFVSESSEGGKRGLTFLTKAVVVEETPPPAIEETVEDPEPIVEDPTNGEEEPPADGVEGDNTTEETPPTDEQRAREGDGTFKADDPATPEANEAFDPPKKVAKKAVKKAAKKATKKTK